MPLGYLILQVRFDHHLAVEEKQLDKFDEVQCVFRWQASVGCVDVWMMFLALYLHVYKT